MQNVLGEIISASRQRKALSQIEYGVRYNVTGPAVIKYEKGYWTPSLELWLKMAADAPISERHAVLLWARSRLPAPFQEYIELPQTVLPEAVARPPVAPAGSAAFKDDDQACEGLKISRALPPGFKQLLEDDEFRNLYKPAAAEINRLREIISVLGHGSKTAYCEMLLLIRAFMCSC